MNRVGLARFRALSAPLPLARLLWAWKALPPQTIRKRLADRLWAICWGDESDADALLG